MREFRYSGGAGGGPPEDPGPVVIQYPTVLDARNIGESSKPNTIAWPARPYAASPSRPAATSAPGRSEYVPPIKSSTTPSRSNS